MGCDSIPSHLNGQYFQFQSTHPRGVRPRRWGAPWRPWSFNPRTRVGCDAAYDYGYYYFWVSIHAPAWGATRGYCAKDPAAQVSIHAPAWGATIAPAISPAAESKFQSTHPRGVRRYQNRYDEYRGHVSIHAPAWGATLRSVPTISSRMSFNPRTRVGCDQGMENTPTSLSTFQSTHPRGVRQEGTATG